MRTSPNASLHGYSLDIIRRAPKNQLSLFVVVRHFNKRDESTSRTEIRRYHIALFQLDIQNAYAHGLLPVGIEYM
jgi:hypothetical protein